MLCLTTRCVHPTLELLVIINVAVCSTGTICLKSRANKVALCLLPSALIVQLSTLFTLNYFEAVFVINNPYVLGLCVVVF